MFYGRLTDAGFVFLSRVVALKATLITLANGFTFVDNIQIQLQALTIPINVFQCYIYSIWGGFELIPYLQYCNVKKVLVHSILKHISITFFHHKFLSFFETSRG